MSKQFQKFMAHVQDKNFELIYAQVRQKGEIIDDWARFQAKPRFESYSTAKSFVGVGVGIAIDEGLISLEERVSDSLKEACYDVTNPYALDLTVKDMLTMTTGTERPMFFRDSYERAHCKDWVRYFYEKGNFIYPPGTHFLYNNVNPYLLGVLIEKKCGKNLYEYLRYRLFEPLEIRNPDWTICPKGHTVGGNGMAINVDELGRFGQMLLDGGQFKGKRIVSEQFVKDMMTGQVDAGEETVPGHPDTHLQYGYQIWVDPVHKCAFLWGVFGQYCIIVPEKELVITIQGLQDDDGGSNGAYGISPLRMKIWEDLVTQY